MVSKFWSLPLGVVRQEAGVLRLEFERNIALRYDTGMIRVSYEKSNFQSYGTNTYIFNQA